MIVHIAAGYLLGRLTYQLLTTVYRALKRDDTRI